jgi:hypothetical protein
MVVEVFGALDASLDPAAAPDPCGLGSFALAPFTNFLYPLRAAEIAFRATLEGFFHGAELAPQFHRHPPPPAPPAVVAPPPKRR